MLGLIASGFILTVAPHANAQSLTDLKTAQEKPQSAAKNKAAAPHIIPELPAKNSSQSVNIDPNATNPQSNEPLEITADQTLEWHRNDLQFIARGNVKTVQGDVSILADTQTALYRETASSDFDIYRLTADGQVRIISNGSTAQGDMATYDVDKGVAVLTGKDLKLTTPERTLTARDSIEYFVTQGKLIAIGDAVVTEQKNRIRADRMTALFKTDPRTGQRRVDTMSATGNVIITTPDEVLKGDRGTYDAKTNIARLIGHVTITRGPNVLSGESAEVNLTTNVSKMHGGGATGGRVSGRFFPGSDKK